MWGCELPPWRGDSSGWWSLLSVDYLSAWCVPLLCFWGLRWSSMHLPAQSILEFHDFQSSSELEPGQVKDSAVSHSVPCYLMRTPQCTPQGSFSAQFRFFIISINYSGLSVSPKPSLQKFSPLAAMAAPLLAAPASHPRLSLPLLPWEWQAWLQTLTDVIFGRIPKALPILAPLLHK